MAENHMKPHVLHFPMPAQGHIPPMLYLAELLSDANLFVTFLNTEHIQDRLSHTSRSLEWFNQMPNFRFRTIPDGLPKDDPRPSQGLFDLAESMNLRCRGEYREILASADGWPPITCVVADGFLPPLALEVAEEMKVPVMILRTSSACSVWAYYNTPELIRRGEIPATDVMTEEGGFDKAINSVAGMESFLRLRDLPSLIRQAESTDNRVLQYVMTISAHLTRSRALIINTVEAIEASVLSHIRTVCPITYALGPLHTLVKANFASLWQQDGTCLKWLDSQPPKSVVYVSYGSITVMSRDSLLEFWHGLVNSGHRFLWVMRPDLVTGQTLNETSPVELEAATRTRGCLVAWAPQQDVLVHPAVGCFLTHSGWNSTLESIVAGVPMICWPFIGDQQINSRFMSKVWKIGMDMKDTCERSIIERMIREVMDGEGANEMRKLAGEMAETARQSTKEGGSSHQDLQKLIQHISSLSTQNN